MDNIDSMDNITNLLNQIGVIREKNAEILEASGGMFNMFEVCGVNHYENTHSKIIAAFLDTKGCHGLKDKFLKCFVDTFVGDFSNGFKCKHAKVHVEHTVKMVDGIFR